MKFYKKSFKSLINYCEKNNFKGWDPYDGLNSEIFSLTPLKNWDIARLIMIQAFKRNPINLRKLALIKKGYNPKGLALILSGYCNLYKRHDFYNCNSFGTKSHILSKINYLSNLLIELSSKGYSGSCWGYNFDWQARRIFFFPKQTPNVVATSFCATSLFESYEITKNKKYLNTALSTADFILNDLKRTKLNDGFLFSYSPISGNNKVYNASMLGCKVLSYCYKFSGNEHYIEKAYETALACAQSQNEDGSWIYGEHPVQVWKDSFHTGYVLESFSAYQEYSGDKSFQEVISRGLKFYIDKFFLNDGTPKYYDNKTYPIDIHCPGQLFVTLRKLGQTNKHNKIIEKVLKWTINNMQDKKAGFFYYQKKRFYRIRIPYMRWSNAFMFYSLSNFFLNQK